MKIHTSYFANIKNLLKENVVLVSIAVGYPKFLKISLREISLLAPRRDMLHMSEERYRVEFFKILASVDVKFMMKMLRKISDEEEGKDICLLCYEKIGDWCHRHMVSEWLATKGFKCEELITEAQRQKMEASKPIPKAEQGSLF